MCLMINFLETTKILSSLFFSGYSKRLTAPDLKSIICSRTTAMSTGHVQMMISLLMRRYRSGMIGKYLHQNQLIMPGQ